MDLYIHFTLSKISKISKYCPRALSTYLQILTRIDEKGEAILTKDQIIDDLNESYTKFKNDLKALCKEDLAEWKQKRNSLHIQLKEPERRDAR